MEGSIPFEASEDGFYKIVSALDQSKCFTLRQSRLTIDNYSASSAQKFNIYSNNGKFAFVCGEGGLGLMVSQDSAQDGAAIVADASQHKSSFFELLTVTSGPFAGKGFYLKTFCGKSLDVNEGRTSPGTAVIQWSYHGNNNQIWLAYPPDSQPQQQQAQQQATKTAFQEVPANFVPAAGPYKVLSALNTSKALTVGADRALKISDYSGDASQKFNLYAENGKIALVVSSVQQALCVAKDSQQNGAKVISDNGRHPSSWFELVRAPAGEWQNKGYKIKTSAHKALDVTEGRTDNGTPVVQWADHNDGYNQVWLVVPADQPVQKYESKTNSGTSLFGINLPKVSLPFPTLPSIGFPKFM